MLGNIVQPRHIKLLKSNRIEELAELCRKCHVANGFDGEFDADTCMGTIQAISDKDEHLAIVWEEDDKILGMGLFLLVPSIVSMSHKKLYEVAWDADPDIHPIRRGRIMVSLLKFVLEYYKGIAHTAHISVPCNNRSVRRYLFNQGFIPKEVCHVKEL